MTQSEFNTYDALAAKMDRIARQRGRTYTSTADLTAEERATFRRLRVLADAEQGVNTGYDAFPSRPA